MSEMCCTRLAKNTRQKLRKKSASVHHRTTLSGYIFATKACIDNPKKTCFLNSNISSTCPHHMVNVSPLTAEISWWVWGILANFNVFSILASLLHQNRAMEVNQTVHDVWPSPGTLYTFLGALEA